MAATGLNSGNWDLSFTSQNNASTVVGPTTVGNMGPFTSLSICAILTGATGGTTDIYLQMSPDGGTTWLDYAHFPQMSSGASAITRMWTVSRSGQQTTLTTVGSNNTVALANNTIVGGEWGDRLRVVTVSGTNTSAGAAQVIKLIGTSQN